jgi:DNA modification methylase
VKTNRVVVGDCVELLAGMPRKCADLVFADPPFNIGYEYDGYDDNLPPERYMAWCQQWSLLCRRILKPEGSFWLAIGDAYASDLDCMVRHVHGFRRIHWVVWHFTFGVNCKSKFTPSKTHLFHYRKRQATRHTFNADAVKVPSARQLVYKDKRAKSGGRLPDDVWSPVIDDPRSDTWKISRVCGTFRERTGHPCQMPEAVLERVIKSTSNEGDLVVDPFAGSGTTLAVAKRLGRQYLGFELNPKYAKIIRKRLR